MSVEFKSFPKIARLMRECIITEKIDGTNGQIHITEDKQLYVGSRNQWISTPENPYGADPFGFARWVHDHKEELIEGLGPGSHFGEWWGQGIQRKYGLDHKRFSLFNVTRWGNRLVRPSCCDIVPVLYQGIFGTHHVEAELCKLSRNGSLAAPGFMNPEGVVIYHIASNTLFKRTIEKDEEPKGKHA